MASIAKYNETLRALKSARGISHKEAQHAYRSMRVRLGRTPTAKDAKSKIAKEEATRAPKAIAQAKKNKLREIERIIEKVKREHPSKKQRQEKRDGDGSRGGGADRGGGGGGGLVQGGGGGGGYEDYYDGFEDDQWYDYEDPLQDTGEAAE